jgi:hypothetical protein
VEARGVWHGTCQRREPLPPDRGHQRVLVVVTVAGTSAGQLVQHRVCGAPQGSHVGQQCRSLHRSGVDLRLQPRQLCPQRGNLVA